MTRVLAPEVVGEVIVAWIVVWLASLSSQLGLDQYLIVKHDDGDDVPFHCTLYLFVLGFITLIPVVLAGEALGHLLNAPSLLIYLPGCAVGMFIRRMATIPDRILARDLRFRASASAQ
ncbi:MAG: oligosaccharide flippase family protein, partial [Myxococcota bacterium]